jgi:hypothetical protein
LLAIDWDQSQLHLAAVRTQRRGMQVEWASDWDMGEDLTPRSAEAIGKRLREFLKAEGIAAGPTVVAIGREKVILKEVRFPHVSAGEEAALVRFQATKDVTDPPDTLEIDYSPRPPVSGASDRQALAVLTRKDVTLAVRALCRGAGLKLLGLAPRPFGASYALERTLQAGGSGLATDAVQGMLTIGQRWAELCLFRGHELLLARSLPADSALVGEVKRSLAVFAAQNAADPRLAGPGVLYVFGNGQSPAPALAAALPCPVEVASPLTIADGVAPSSEHQGPLAGAVGLAQRWSVARSLPVNLAVAKKTQTAGSPTRQRWLVYSVTAGLLLAAAVGSMYYVLSVKRGQIQKLTLERNRSDDDLRALAQDRVDIEALKEWQQGTIPWLDELYDLTARFPYEKGFRINHFVIEPGSGKKGAKDAPAAKIRITGVTPAGQSSLALNLRDAINRDGHLKATIERQTGGRDSQFTIRIDVAKQPASKYETILAVPPEALHNGKKAGRQGGE